MLRGMSLHCGSRREFHARIFKGSILLLTSSLLGKTPQSVSILKRQSKAGRRIGADSNESLLGKNDDQIRVSL